MKTYIAIAVGVVVLFSVVFVGYKFTNKSGDIAMQDKSVRMAKIEGSVTRKFEGDHVINYSFNIPETATSAVSMDGALVRVSRISGVGSSVYFSYEGARGYSAKDYLADKIAPAVSVLTETGTTTLGGYEWLTATSAGSEYYIASTEDGQWLIVVEAKKVLHDDALELLRSINLK